MSPRSSGARAPRPTSSSSLGIPLAFLLAVLRRLLARNAIAAGRPAPRHHGRRHGPALPFEALIDPTLKSSTGCRPRAAMWTPSPGHRGNRPATTSRWCKAPRLAATTGNRLPLIVANPALLRHPHLPGRRYGHRPCPWRIPVCTPRYAQIGRIHSSQQRLLNVVAAERRRIEDDIANGASGNNSRRPVNTWERYSEIQAGAKGPGQGLTARNTSPRRPCGLSGTSWPPSRTNCATSPEGWFPGTHRIGPTSRRHRDGGHAPQQIQVDLPPDRFGRATEVPPTSWSRKRWRTP